MDGCSRQNPAYRPASERAPGDGSPLQSRPQLRVPPTEPSRDACYPFSDLRHHADDVPLGFAASRRTARGDGFAGRRRARSSPLAFGDVTCEHVFVIVCVLLPRFALAVAAGGREVLAAGPVALAPEPGRDQLIGEVSAAAEAYGVRAGLRLGEALARCPTLRLVAPDPVGVADAWDARVRALEGIGAAVEPGPPGTAWFGAGGLRTLHGGTLEGVLAATRRALEGAGPARRGAFALRRLGGRRPRARTAAGDRPDGRRRAGRLHGAAARRCSCSRVQRSRCCRMRSSASGSAPSASWPSCRAPRWPTASAAAGPLARDLAQGKDTPLVPRTAAEQLEERLELPESASGMQLQRGLDLLIDRLLARRERRGRALRAVVLSAKLVEGGTWRARVTFREPLADPRRMRLVLGQKLAELPGARRRAAPARRRASARRRATSARCSPSRPRSAARACARPCARHAPWRAPTRRCGSSPSIPTRGCPSGA